MNDILPKPFTREGLLGILEKHLNHLKIMKEMARLDSSARVLLNPPPPPDTESVEDAAAAAASASAVQSFAASALDGHASIIFGDGNIEGQADELIEEGDTKYAFNDSNARYVQILSSVVANDAAGDSGKVTDVTNLDRQSSAPVPSAVSSAIPAGTVSGLTSAIPPATSRDTRQYVVPTGTTNTKRGAAVDSPGATNDRMLDVDRLNGKRVRT
jgi:hypothetical protein